MQLMNTLTKKQAGQKILWIYYGEHLNHPFIRLASRTLSDAGHFVTVIDLSQNKDVTSYQHIRLKKPDSITTNSLAKKLLAFSKIGLYFLLLLFKSILVKPEIIIISTPHVAVIAWVLSRLFNARFVYYPFELFGEQTVKVSSAKLKSLEILMLQRWIHALITQNEERAKIYTEERKARIAPVIVHNYKSGNREVENSGRLRKMLKFSKDTKIILYEGYIQDGRWLDILVESLLFLSDDTKLVFIGRMDMMWWDRNIKPLLEQPEISNKLMVVPWINHNEILDYVSDANVGIIIYDDSVRNNIYCEPGKLSDYIFAGVPVVAPSFPTIAPVIEHYKIGSVFKKADPESIAEAIKHVLSIPKEAWTPALESAKNSLTWETQVVNFTSAILGISEKNLS